jgi:hypothetical protein
LMERLGAHVKTASKPASDGQLQEVDS